MGINIADIQTVRKLIFDLDEANLVDSPPDGLHRFITRLRFDNHDSIVHTPTFYIREADYDKFTVETPEQWRLWPARAIAASGGFLEDCSGQVAIMTTGQSLTVQLAANPSDTSDELVWPAVTVNYMDQIIS